MNCMHYRISKYLPEHYNENGVYTKDEWTSKYDIGKIYDNQVFEEKEYLLIENRYIDAVNYLLAEHEVDCLIVSELELNSSEDEENEEIKECIASLEEGAVLTKEDIEFVCRAMLRECVWCKLCSPKSHFILSVGYDFYMHLICKKLTDMQINKINSIGLYIEEIV